jgi:hypothetical protein
MDGFFGLFALHELADLAADASECFQLMLIRFAALVTEEFEYSDNFAAARDRNP